MPAHLALAFYTVIQKGIAILLSMYSPNIDRFFHSHTYHQEICNKVIVKDPTISKMCRYTTVCPKQSLKMLS